MSTPTQAKVLDAIARLEKVKLQIRATPESLYMDTWIVPKHDRKNSEYLFYLPRNYCGTVACIAGHLYLNYLEENDIPFDDKHFFDRKNENDTNVIRQAKDLICSSFNHEYYAANIYTTKLFNTSYWPIDLRNEYSCASLERRVEIACEVIDSYIHAHLKPFLTD